MPCPHCLEEVCDGGVTLHCGHTQHRRCLEAMVRAGHRPPTGVQGLQLLAPFLRCPVCRADLHAETWLAPLLAPLDALLAKMRTMQRRFVAVEYATADARCAALVQMEERRHFHFCATCREPQLLERGRDCGDSTDDIPPCPTCHPEHYEKNCPGCRGRLWVSHGCSQIRCCGHGENCGLDRKAADGTCDPQDCNHMGGCGCVFSTRPAPLLLVPDMDRLMTRLYGAPVQLLHHHTRHDLDCAADGCTLCRQADAVLDTSPFYAMEQAQLQVVQRYRQMREFEVVVRSLKGVVADEIRAAKRLRRV